MKAFGALYLYNNILLFFLLPDHIRYVKTRKLHFEWCALKAHWNVDYLNQIVR